MLTSSRCTGSLRSTTRGRRCRRCAHLRSVGVESFKRISMIHFLIFNNGYDWIEVVNAPQGVNAEGIEKAKQMLEEVTVAFAEAQSTAESAKAPADAKKAEVDEEAAVERQKEAPQMRRRRRRRPKRRRSTLQKKA